MALPYSVWVKQQDQWSYRFGSHNPVECKDYAQNKVVHGNTIERIEIHDLTGCLETVWDASWEAR